MSNRLPRGPVVAAASLFIVLIVAEGSHRAWLRIRGAPFDRARVEERLDRVADTTAAFVPGARRREEGQDGKAGGFGILHPYYGSEVQHDTGDVLRWFRLRGTEDDSYRVLVMGGSVAASWGADLNRVFAGRLEADPRLGGRRVRLLQFAHAGYKEPQQVTQLAYLFSFGYRVDAVINLDGFNELACSVSNAFVGTNPNYPSTPVWGQVLRDRRDFGVEGLDALADLRNARNDVVAFVGRARRWRLTVSSLASVAVERRANALCSRAVDAAKRYLAAVAAQASQSTLADRQMNGPPFESGLEAVVETAATCWFEGSLSLDALCSARGVYYVHCLQPTLFDPGSKVVSAEEEAIGDGPTGWRQAVERGYPLLRDRGAELARLGIAFHDVSQSFASISQTLYFDPCHFHPPGNRVLSEVIADRFLAGLPDPHSPDDRSEGGGPPARDSAASR